MGSWLSRLSRPVGSKPYYSSVERSLERLRAEADTLKVRPPFGFAAQSNAFHACVISSPPYSGFHLGHVQQQQLTSQVL